MISHASASDFRKSRPSYSAMTDPAIELRSDVPSADRAAVVKGLVEYNAKHGYPWP